MGRTNELRDVVEVREWRPTPKVATLVAFDCDKLTVDVRVVAETEDELRALVRAMIAPGTGVLVTVDEGG